MDRKIKERLIGLIVLMTLAVIFLPMMLGGPEEGGGERRLSLESAEESALPETRLDLRESPEEDDDSSGEEADFAAEESDPRLGDVSPEPDASDGEPAVPEDEAADAAATEEDTGADAESAEEDTAEAPNGDDDGAEDEASSAEAFEGPSGSGWTAQVGSFTRRENAEDLVDSLRDSGFEAFLMRHEGSEKVFYRVRVGLESEREEATELARRVHSETGHEATAVPHP